MKKIYYTVGIFVTVLFKAQVGVNVATPQKALDINGDLNIRKALRTDGTDNTQGNAGTAGQLYKVKTVSSQLNDSWQTVQIADGTGSLSLFYLNTVKDTNGVEFNQSNLAGTYNLDEGFTTSTNTSQKNWAWITNAKDTFTVTKTDNKSKAVLSFQTVAQITTTSGAPFASFACGIFVSKDGGTDQLKAVRNDVITGSISGVYKIYNLNVTLDGLAAGIYTVKSACANRSLTGTGIKLGIGKAMDPVTLTNDMAQTTLTTSVLQTY